MRRTSGGDDDENGECKEEEVMPNKTAISTRLLVGRAPIGSTSRGAGYARNRAASLRDILLPDDDEYDDKYYDGGDDDDDENDDGGEGSSGRPMDEDEKGTGGRLRCRRQGQRRSRCHHYMCIMDADDVMKPTRIAEQTLAMMNITNENVRRRTLLGCQFDRIPHDSTLHYTTWANTLCDDRLYLERYRECTLVRMYGILLDFILSFFKFRFPSNCALDATGRL